MSFVMTVISGRVEVVVVQRRSSHVVAPDNGTGCCLLCVRTGSTRPRGMPPLVSEAGDVGEDVARWQA